MSHRRRAAGRASLLLLLGISAANGPAAAADPSRLCERGRPETLLLAADFDGDGGGFSTASGAGSSWRLDATAGVGGSGAWVAADIGPLSLDRLVSPPVALPASAEELLLSFHSRRALEGSGIDRCFDGALVEVDRGAGPEPLAPAAILADPYSGIILTGFGNPLAGLAAWCDQLDAFRETRIDLAAFAGADARLVFTLATDESVELAEPWRLDQLRVAACGPQDILFAAGFEAALPGEAGLSRDP